MDTFLNYNTTLSIGIDIGTTTTQVAFSRFTIVNDAGMFSVPDIVIKSKELIYKSPSKATPIVDDLLDGIKLRHIVEDAFLEAGLDPEDISTGAVIVTGEASKRNNAKIASENLASIAGDFVVATAGPDMEAIIAGHGSGASAWSEENDACVVNIDIGGGTCSLASYTNGINTQCGSFDIGGRGIVEDRGRIVEISPQFYQLAHNCGVDLEIGQEVDLYNLEKLIEATVSVLEAAVKLSELSTLYQLLSTKTGSSWLPIRPDAIFFSGGVADCIYQHINDPFYYHDLGVLLGRAIRSSRLMQEYRVLQPAETIHATVLGAGSYTMHVSGSTVTYTDGLFPLRDLPVLRLSQDEEQELYDGLSSTLNQKINWFCEQVDTEHYVISMRGRNNPDYSFISSLAETIASTPAIQKLSSVILLIENDMAKSLGQALQVVDPSADIICLDGIKTKMLDYIDIGKPLMAGQVVPVVVKTLIYGTGIS